jgi:hypothetical protein
LYERFGARFALILRRPDRVVTSFHTKGWYESVPPRSDPNLAPGYLDGARRAWHPFSRLLPLGDDGREFESWTRVGRLAWFWSQLNSRALDLIEALPADHQRVMRIEDFDHERHQDLMRFLGSESKLDEAVFATARKKRPESYDHSHTIHDWSPQECAEFEQQTRELATRLGYEWKTQTIRSAEPRREAPQPQRRQQRRKSLRDHLKRGVRILRGPSKHRDP